MPSACTVFVFVLDATISEHDTSQLPTAMQFASTPAYSPGIHSNGDTREALSARETLQAATLQMRSGCSDAMRFKTVYQLIQEDPRVKSNVLKSTLLQVVLLASVIALDFIIAPKLARKGLQAGDRVQFYYQVFWLWPYALFATVQSSADSRVPDYSAHHSSSQVKRAYHNHKMAHVCKLNDRLLLRDSQ